ncbi:hypothetical protein EVAR_83512_1 [Eumeta japonica]|uniref:Uncharacterized protein n=1 Tax=Eumeta variegata TaxID=151549 RepID=A0A4C1Y2L3_EUMVA|nr:hypothetical protein EVAR_83512_1 [Eumeta japonica]
MKPEPRSRLDQEGIMDEEWDRNNDGCVDHSDISRHKRSNEKRMCVTTQYSGLHANCRGRHMEDGVDTKAAHSIKKD